ncbi:RNA 2',3'-cyclic phosphodiesterase [Neobacillus niacini]|uniref:RNA 2',3'-cyclic phosphodiesterase n=1 Tax=Neobacillus niacini TaxID=86668 RepID=UPI002866A1CE|nr:RNA 2',3'-cyclic phosphodiesterase [Neobacillus niacini]MDR7000510.1 2'-5' RNA ligase [Neobacillus niacini]
MTHQTHFFYAVPLPKEIKLIMKDHCEKLKLSLPFNRWVHHEDLHITLAFLGFASLEQLEKSKEYVRNELRGIHSFSLKINQLGIFGRKESPRIFWGDTIKSDELQSARKKVFTACEDAGFQLETRPFRPHITLARKWSGEEPFQNEMLDVWHELQQNPLAFLASEVVLFQTHLQKTPKYEVKEIFPLI